MRILVTALSLALAGIVPAAAAAEPPLTLCAEPAKGSAWFRPVHDVTGKPTGRFTGFSVDMLRRAFARIGRETTFIGDIPWSRCMQMVERGEIDYAFGAYHDEERARRFAYSIPYKRLTPQVFFLDARPIAVQHVDDLKRYRGCGMFGSTYAHYGIDDRHIDRGANSYDVLVKKLKLGRCDYIPEELEVVAGLASTEGVNYLKDPELRHAAVPGALGPGRHLIAARSSAAAALLPSFNASISTMIKSGEFEQIWKKSTAAQPQH